MSETIDFSPYKLIAYDKHYENELIGLLAKSYAQFSEKGEVIELNSLDKDLLEIDDIYCPPSTFQLLIDPKRNNKLVGSVAVKIFNPSQEEKKTLFASDKKEDAPYEAEIKRVFIDPEYRSQGLGKKLSEWAFEYAKDQGCELMHIWSGTFCHKAHKLYQDLGAKDMQQKRSIGGMNNVEEYYFVKELV